MVRNLLVVLTLIAVIAIGCNRRQEEEITAQPQGPVCQSCAMPMEKPEMFGTNTDGSQSVDYCTYCLQKGQFMEPDITMQEMIDKCVTIMDEKKIMPANQARHLLTITLPTLKRWNVE